jgi:ABC-2 type transport system permease protein
MIKLLHIAREEIAYHLRQWAFYLTALGMPLLFATAGLLPQLASVTEQTPLASVETIFSETKVVTVPTGYVDYAGLIKEVPAGQAEKLRAFPDEASAQAALQQNQIESYYVIHADYLASGRVTQYSQKPQLLAGVDDVVQRVLRDNLLAEFDNPRLVKRIEKPFDFVRQGPPPATFSFIPAGSDLSRLASAGLVLLLFTYLINVGGSLILRSLQREVRARVLEVLIVSTTPGQFIGGKLLGLTGLTLLQGLVALVAGALVYGRNPAGSGPAALPLALVSLSLPYLLLGYVAYCGGLMGLTTIWPNLPESGTLLAMVRLLMYSPLLGILFIIPNPDGPLAVALTIIPLTAPLLTPFRLLLTEVPWWQWSLGLLLLALLAAFSVWLSARLFRMQSLLTGRPVSPAMIWAAWRG